MLIGDIPEKQKHPLQPDTQYSLVSGHTAQEDRVSASLPAQEGYVSKHLQVTQNNYQHI